MTQPVQQKPTQPKWGVTFPEGEKPHASLYSRDSLTRACRGNERMASVLDYFLYEGSWEIERQGLPEGCKVVAFIRKHVEILKRLTFNLSRKSLIGFLDAFNEWKFILSEKYHNHYTVDFEAVQAAIDTPPAPKERKPRARKGCKVEAITTEDNASTLAKKVEELQLKVELLQHYVEVLQPLGCNTSTLQRDFAALAEAFQRHFPEDHILLDYPYLSSTDKEDSGAFAPSDFLPPEDEISEEDEPPPTVKMPAIKLNGHMVTANTPPRAGSHETGSYPPQVPSMETAGTRGEQTPGPGALPSAAESPQFGRSSGITSGQAIPSLLLVPEPAQAALPPADAQVTGERGKPGKPTEAKETAKQKKARLERRRDEIIALHCQLLGRNVVRSKDELEGARLMAEAGSTDVEITLTYHRYKKDKFWGHQLTLKNIAKLLDTTVANDTSVPTPAKPRARPKPEDRNISIYEIDPSWQVWQRPGEDQEWIWWQGEFWTPDEADDRGYNGGGGLYIQTQYAQGV